jgi:hypothetical protein
MGAFLSFSSAIQRLTPTRQLGLGNVTPLESVTVPTEVILWRFTSPTSKTKCLNVSAGS